MFSPQDIKVKLKEMAAELKFDDLRICDVGDFSESDKTKFYNCMNLGMFDKMEYLKRAAEKKISPTKYFPKAKSAVCVCANFWRESSEKRIALYAQSEDYHRVIKPKLLMLSKLLEEFGGEQKVSVDSSPLWEKLLGGARRTRVDRKKHPAYPRNQRLVEFHRHNSYLARAAVRRTN